MLDAKFVRTEPDIVRQALINRKQDPALLDTFLALDEQRRKDLVEVEAPKAERNTVSEEIAKMKTLVTDNMKTLGAEDSKKYQDQIAALEAQAGGLQGEIDNKNLLKAYNDAKSIKDQIAAATQEISAKLEAAKAKKGAKPAKKN